MTRGWGPYRSPPKLKDRFYKTIILADAIKAVRPLNRQLKSADLATEHPLDREEEVFRRFIDKLAQFCDSRMGGPTVTAVAVLESAIGPLFVLASNQRTTKADRAVAEFVASLLRQVRELGETEPGNDSWAAKRDRLLEDVIAFNKTRIADLIKKVRKTAVTSLSALADDTTPGGRHTRFSWLLPE